MALYYFSAVEFIRNRKFEVMVPAFYHPHMPDHIVKPDTTPLPKVNRWKKVPVNRLHPTPFNPVDDPDRLQSASYSIEIMLDMFKKQIEFIIVNEDDIVEIFEGLDRYLISLQQDVETGDERIITYARLVVQWRAEVYKHYFRYMMTHPLAKEKLYPNNDPTKNLLHLLSIANGIKKEQYELDPLRARQFPPYDIDKIMPKAHDAPQTMGMMMESTLGLSSESPSMIDDGKDFNFDDFLKRG